MEASFLLPHPHNSSQIEKNRKVQSAARRRRDEYAPPRICGVDTKDDRRSSLIQSQLAQHMPAGKQTLDNNQQSVPREVGSKNGQR